MEIYPALDLLDGECVRLLEGDFDQKTTYSTNPEATVTWIRKSGASFLHLVDLSGAKEPKRRQAELIRKIVSQSDLRVQCGGGIRSAEEVRDLLESGVDRVVLGSLSVTQPELTKSIFKEFGPNRLTLALDVKADHIGSFKIATHGWKRTSNQDLFEWIQLYRGAGLERILCTDIRRDGMMTGPNLELYRQLVQMFPQIQIQASGGISSLQDLRSLKEIGVHSAITGKALYEGKISLPEALVC